MANNNDIRFKISLDISDTDKLREFGDKIEAERKKIEKNPIEVKVNTDEAEQSISDLYDNLEKVTKDLKEQRILLQSELSKVDKEISDIRHYIEFYPLNACQGYKAAKMMKDCLIRRRAIKNEMEVIDRIAVMNVSFIGSGRGRIKLTQERDKHYRPRVLKELFEDF